MSHEEITHIKNFIKEEFEALKENSIQQRFSHHSDLLKQMIEIEQKLTTKIDENTKITTELTKHPIFKAWNDGKTIAKFIKYGGIAIIGISTLIVAIKNGGSIIKEYLKFALKI